MWKIPFILEIILEGFPIGFQQPAQLSKIVFKKILGLFIRGSWHFREGDGFLLNSGDEIEHAFVKNFRLVPALERGKHGRKMSADDYPYAVIEIQA